MRKITQAKDMDISDEQFNKYVDEIVDYIEGSLKTREKGLEEYTFILKRGYLPSVLNRVCNLYYQAGWRFDLISSNSKSVIKLIKRS